MTQKHVYVLFDGVCNLCHWSVRFLKNRDKNGVFRFYSQKSLEGKNLLNSFENHKNIDAIIVIDKRLILSESDAILYVLKFLAYPWRILYVFRYVPKTIRDTVYRFIAKYRYSVFGKKSNCSI